LMQETFFKVYRNLHRFRGASSFRTWLFQIALNTARNELRRRSRRPTVSDVPLDVWGETPSAADDVEHAWDDQILRAGLELAWSGLRADQRELLRLKDLDGHSYTEIARHLGITLSAAKMRVQRARLALQLIYRRQEGERV
jgi:RNA polymerase sigma-70 factor (ECF subfamily)